MPLSIRTIHPSLFYLCTATDSEGYIELMRGDNATRTVTSAILPPEVGRLVTTRIRSITDHIPLELRTNQLRSEILLALVGLRTLTGKVVLVPRDRGDGVSLDVGPFVRGTRYFFTLGFPHSTTVPLMPEPVP